MHRRVSTYIQYSAHITGQAIDRGIKDDLSSSVRTRAFLVKPPHTVVTKNFPVRDGYCGVVSKYRSSLGAALKSCKIEHSAILWSFV